MQLLQAINIGLDKGLMGILNAYIKEQKDLVNPPPDKVFRIRLSVKYAPLLQVLDDRLIKTIAERSNRPVKAGDAAYQTDATAFYNMLTNVNLILANPKDKELSNRSCWLKYNGDVRTSPYLTLETYDKEGKIFITSASIGELIV